MMATFRNYLTAIAASLILASASHILAETCSEQDNIHKTRRYVAGAGTATFDFNPRALQDLGFRFIASSQIDDAPTEHRVVFGVAPSSTLQVETEGGVYAGLVGGILQTRGALLLDKPGNRVVIGNLALKPRSDGILTIQSTLNDRDASVATFELTSVMIDLRSPANELLLISELAITDEWALDLDLPDAGGTIIGTLAIAARVDTGVETKALTTRLQTNATAGERSTSTESGVGSDIVVAELQSVRTYGEVGGITAYAIGTTACNIGTARASWDADTNQHPVIVQNLYRLMDNRFEQIGLSWVKHGFYAVSESLCTPCYDPVEGGQELGVACSDPYSATLNGIQTNMSPRWLVDAHTGYFPFPWNSSAPDLIIERRLQVHNEDLDPDLNPQARYFMQGHYVHPDDCASGTNNNNASYREVSVERSAETGYWTIIINYRFQTQRGQPAVRAWKDTDGSVSELDIQVPGEGLFILAAKAMDLGGGVWRYEYALQNLNSDRAAGSFSVPLPDNAVVANGGFHDVDFHSGDRNDPTDWRRFVVNDAIHWSTDSFDVDPYANALRWGTVYNFRFDANGPPVSTAVTIELFKPGTPDAMTAIIVGPASPSIDCNGNGIPDPCDVSCDPVGCPGTCGLGPDCNNNVIPDECETDCNENGIPDECDISGETSGDCDADGIPDECESPEDCNDNGVRDFCDLIAGTSKDCNDNNVPDECDADSGIGEDCNTNNTLDECDLATGTSGDCNDNGVPDECDIAPGGSSNDSNGDGVPDDCTSPGVPREPHDHAKNRYVSIDASMDTADARALRVTLTSMKRCSGDDRRACIVDGDCPGVCTSNKNLQCTSDAICGVDGPCVPTSPCTEHDDVGTITKWIDEPFEATCFPLDDCVGQSFAQLGDDPFYREWTEAVLHITDCEIVPVATYEIRATVDGVIFSDPLTIGTIGKPNVHYADCVGPVEGDPPAFTAPDGFTNVTDVQAYLIANQDGATASHTTTVDLHGAAIGTACIGTDCIIPQQILNVSDLQTIKFGFLGQTYIETPGHENPGDCP